MALVPLRALLGRFLGKGEAKTQYRCQDVALSTYNVRSTPFTGPLGLYQACTVHKRAKLQTFVTIAKWQNTSRTLVTSPR